MTRPLLLTALLASAFTLNIAAQAAAELPSDWDERIRQGVKAYEKGEHRAAFDMFSQLMVEGNRRFGPSDGNMARLYTNMGEVYNEEGQYKYAEDCLKKGLNIAQKGYGESSLQSVPALIDLGQCYVHQGKDFQAKPLFDKALAIVDKAGGDDEMLPYITVIEANIGMMYFSQGSYPFSESHFKRAFDLAAKAFGPTHKWTTTIGGMYASCMHAQGKTKEAKAIERFARAKANESQSPFATWDRHMKKAESALADKKYADAEVSLKQATTACQDLTSEPMCQVLTLQLYGKLLVAQKKPTLAIEKWKVAQGLADTILGLEDQAVLAHAKELADLEKTQNQYREAEPLYVRVVANTKKQFGAESEEYANSVQELADMYTAWAQYPKAVTYYTKLLTWQEKKYGTDSEKLIPTLVSLGSAAANNTKYFTEVNDKAEEHLKRSADIATKKFGKNAKEMVGILDALSRYYQRHFDWEKAAKACAQMVAVDEKNYGPDGAETVKALERYAVVLRAGGLRNEAETVEARIAKSKGPKGAPED